MNITDELEIMRRKAANRASVSHFIDRARHFAETRKRLMVADDVESIRQALLFMCDECEQLMADVRELEDVLFGDNYGCEIEAARRSAQG